MSPEITMVDGWGKFGPSPKLEIIKKAFMDDYRFASLQFAVNPAREVEDVAYQYAKEWLNLNDKDAKLMAEVIAGLGTQIIQNRDYVYFKDGTDNPLADERLKKLIQIRSRYPVVEDNYRYWLLNYRTVNECFSTIKGDLPLDELYNELALTKKQITRLEPEYGKHLAEMERWHKPELSPLGWPRSFNHIWIQEKNVRKEKSK